MTQYANLKRAKLNSKDYENKHAHIQKNMLIYLAKSKIYGSEREVGITSVTSERTMDDYCIKSLKD